ncbi:hypothetical protein QTH27_03945 [Clostridium perfringens]|nr:hypothetical protein [Clostridium perfringens]MDM0474563.1 hypothetical protein [Clostridium perfringens]MDM0476934.1 hypothetical protein [Clostridium perfringens]MDM0479757.1 hypothetical protein [Clostridium perfringens]MDM0482619.1 hypothetical protein [Clostridium perfringens]
MEAKTIIPNIPHVIILEQLSKEIDIEKFLETSIKFYFVNERHRYSELSKYINKKVINDKSCLLYMLMNLDMILDYIDNNEQYIDNKINDVLNCSGSDKFTYENLKLNIKKLQDHIELEEARLNSTLEREQAISKRMINELNEGIMAAKQNLEEKTSQLEARMNSSFISILGIFAAVLLAFFGGLSLLNTVFSFLGQNISTYKIIFVSCLTGIIIFNIIFILLYVIAKISDRDIGSKCPYRLIFKHEDTKSFIPRAYYRLNIISKRFPLLYWFNVLMILLITTDGILYFIKAFLELYKKFGN